jgi:hypothetical protein
LKKIILAAAVAALAIMAAASTASAGVARNEITTSTLTAATLYNGVTYNHSWTITTNPCDNTFAGTANDGSVTPGETVSGSLNGSKISIAGLYPNGYTWSYTGTLAGVGTQQDSLGQKWTVKFTNTPVSTSSYTSHSDYVTQTGDSGAAHSCIGMPTNGPADSVLGSIVFDNDSFGLANFSFAGQDGGKGTAFYADKSGYYLATATDVEVTGPTSATMSLQVSFSATPEVPVGTQFTVTLHHAPGTSDYFTINNQGSKQFVAKAGAIAINYR